MAKKDKKNELDFDDGLDDLDFGFGDDDFSIDEPKDDRKPVSKVASSFLEGVKDDLVDTHKMRRRAQEALPEEYSSAFEAVDSAADFGRDLYNTAAEELRPAAIQLKRLTRKVSPRLKNALPGKMGEKLDDWAKDDEVKGPSAQEVREQGLATELGDIFKTQIAKDHEDRQEETVQRLFRERVQDHQFQTELEALKDISAGIGSLTSYQDQVTAKYQKKSLELQFRQYYTTHDLFELSKASSKEASTLLKNIVKNTALPESEKIKLGEQAGQVFRERFLGRASDFTNDYLKNYGKNIIGKFKESMGSINESLMTVADQVEMASDMDVKFDPWEMAGQQMGGTVSDKIVGSLIKSIRPVLEKNPDILKWGHKSALAANSIPYALRNMQMDHESGAFKKGEYFDAETGREIRRPEDVTGPVVDRSGKVVLTQEDVDAGKTDAEGRFGGLKRFAKDIIFGAAPNKPNVDTFDVGFDKSMEPATFNEMTRKSITDIIPGYLSRIHHELMILRTGDPNVERMVYNVDRGQFTDMSKSAKDMLNRLFSKEDRKGLDEANKDFLSKVDPKGKMDENQRNALTELMMDEAREGRFDSSYKRYLDTKTYTARGVSEKDAKAIIARMKSSLGYNDRERGFNDTVESTQKRNQTFNRFKRIQSYIPKSEEGIKAYSDLGNIDQLLALGLVDEEENGTYRVNQDKVRSYLKGEQYNEGTRQGAEAPRTGPFTPVGIVGRAGGFDHIQPAPVTAADTQPAKEVRIEEVRQNAIDELIDAYEEGNGVLIETLKAQTEFSADSVELLDNIYQVLQSQGGGEGSGGTGPKKEGFFKRAKGRLGKMGRGFYDFNKNHLKRMGRWGGSAYRGAKKVVGNTLGFVTGKWNKFRSDLKVKGTDRVILYWNKMKDGEYFDAETGKLITHWKDIKGAVKDKYGNIVLTAEEFKEGLVNHKGGLITRAFKGLQSLVGMGFKPLTFAKNLVKGAWDKGVAFLKQEKDIYTPDDMETPKLLARVLKAGGYVSKTTQKRIYSWKEIDGPILDLDGNVKLSLEDFEKGLVDINGKPLKSIMGKIGGLLKKPFDLAKKGFNLGKDALSGVFNGGKDLLLGFLDKLGLGGFKGERADELVSVNKDQLNVLKDIRDVLMDQFKPKGLHDRDGDGDRDGSWQDIFQRRKEKEEEKDPEVKKEKEEKENGWWGKLGGILMGVASFIGGKITSLLNFFKLRAGASVLGDLMGGGRRKGRGLVKGALSLGKKGISALGKGIGWLGKKAGIGKAAGWLGSKIPGAAKVAKAGGWLARGASAAKGLLSLGGLKAAMGAGLAKAGGAALAGVGSVLTAPVALGAAAVAAVGVGGWWLWKKYKSSKVGHITRLRLAQYGIKYTNEDQAKQVLWLESQLQDKVKGDGREAHLDIKEADTSAILENFGLDTKNQESVMKFSAWFDKRFKPVLATHVMALKGLEAPDVDLLDVDDRLSPHIKLNYLKAVKMSEFTDVFEERFSPFGDETEIDVDSEYIEDRYSDALLKISKDRQRVETKAAKMATREGITKEEAVKEIYKKHDYAETGTDLNVDQPKGTKGTDKEGSTTSNDEVRTRSEIDPNILRRREIRYDEVDAMRFKMYGLRELDPKRVEALVGLEEWVYDKTSVVDGFRVVYDEGASKAYKEVGPLFASGLKMEARTNHKEEWEKWFKQRFLPIFLDFATVINLTKERSTIYDARDRFSHKEKFLLAKGLVASDLANISNQMGRTFSPWPDYAVSVAVGYEAEYKSLELKATDKEIKIPLTRDTATESANASKVLEENAASTTSKVPAPPPGLGKGDTVNANEDLKTVNSQFENKDSLPPELQAASGSAPPQRTIPKTEGEAKVAAALVNEGITDPEEQAMALAQLGHESANFTRLEENLRYSASNLKRVFGRYFQRSGEAEQFAGKPEAIANRVYGNRSDLGNTQPGDGWKFRGRGFIQLTGRANYEAASKALGIDFISNPDLVADPKYAAKVSLWWWKNRRGLRSAAQEGDVLRSTKLINGGTNGLQDRKSKYSMYLPKVKSGNLIQQALEAMGEPETQSEVDVEDSVEVATQPPEVTVESTVPEVPTEPSRSIKEDVTQPDITSSAGLNRNDEAMVKQREQSERIAQETTVQNQFTQEMSERSMGVMLKAMEKQLQVQMSMDGTLKSIDGKLGTIEVNTRSPDAGKGNVPSPDVQRGARPVEIGGVKPPVDLSRSI